MAQITINVNTAKSEIKRHLSIIGKRLYSKDGKNLFSDITLSSAEEHQILAQYIAASAQDVEAVLKQFITSTVLNSSGIEMTITNTRGDSDFDTRTQAFASSYVVLNTVGEYLSMTHPDIAQKYHADARQRIEALVAYVFYKNPPATSTTNPLSVNTTIN